jgi:uncharacterized protein (TIGR02300 family)
VTKAELGTKRTCPNCGTKYYDLNRSPIVCPKCGTVFMVTAAAAKARAQAAKAVVEEDEEVEVIPDKEAELVSLEEADEEAAESGAVKVEGVDDEDTADGEEPDDTFLEEEDEEGDDVGDIIGDVDEEER